MVDVDSLIERLRDLHGATPGKIAVLHEPELYALCDKVSFQFFGLTNIDKIPHS
jgi:hypothetical protein